MPQSFGTQLAQKGWQAGSVIPQAMLPVLAPHMARPPREEVPDVAAADWLVVVSHTCDVVQARLENEPLVEVLHCQPVEKLRPDFQGHKSTRRLDFRPDKANHEDIVLSAHAVADRYVVPRDLFANHEPDPGRRLSTSAVENLQQWFALRYSRPAWPDALVVRLNKGKKQFVAALKQLPVDDVEVRVAISEKDDELDEGQNYHLAVSFIVDETVLETSPEDREAVQKVFAAFVSALTACKGIAVNEELSGVFSGGEFTWQMSKTTDEWNFANLSQQD